MGDIHTAEEVTYKQRKRWLFFGLPFSFTVYTVKEDMITINTGFFKRIENDCYMYKVQDVQHTASFIERIFGLGSVVCFTGDTTHPKLMLEHIRMSKEIKNFILEASERARMRRRTLNTLDIGSGTAIDVDDVE